MALSATFTANFASFYDAVEKADVKLKDFGAGADKVGARLTALGNSFSGQKIVQDATLMVKAVEDIGGVTKLTEKEMARLGATTNEAVAKMKALGMDVPKNLQEIANQTKGATKATSDWMGSLTKIGGAVGIAFSVDAIVSFVGSVFDAASAVKDLSDQWGVSTTAVQQWTGAAKQSGVEAETVGKSVQFLTEQIGEGSDAYQALLKNVGLSYDQLRQMPLEDAYKEVVKAIGGIKDETQQLDIAQGLLGTSSKKMVGAIRDGFLEAADATTVMSEETIKRLEAAQASWEKFKNALVIGTGEILAATTMVTESMTRSWGNFFKIVGAGIADTFSGQKTAAGLILMDQAAAGTKKTLEGVATATTTVTSTTAHVLDLAAAHKKVADATAAHAAAIEQTGRAISRGGVLDAMKQMAAEVNAAAKSGGLASDAIERYGKQIQGWLKQGYQVPPVLVDTYREYVILTAAITTTTDATKLLNVVGGDVAPQLRAQAAAAKELADQYKEVAKAVSGDANKLLGSLSGLNVTPGKPPALPKSWGESFATDLAAQIPQAIQRAIEGGGNVGKAIGASIGGTLGKDIGQSVAPQISKAVGGTLGKSLGSMFNAAMPILGELLGAGIGALIDKLTAHKGRDLVTAFAGTQGGFDELHAKLDTLGAEGERMWIALTQGVGSNNPRQAQAAIDAITKALKTQTDQLAAQQKALDDARGKVGELQSALEAFGGVVPAALRPTIAALLAMPGIPADLSTALGKLAKDPSWQTLETAAKDFGIDLKAAGQAFNQAKFGEIALGYARKLHEFADAGFNMQLVIEGMSDELSDLYDNAQKTGVKLPNTLKPYMQTLVEQGRLLDENGQKVDHLNEDTFADIEDKGLTAVVDILKEIATLLRESLPHAAEDGAAHIQDAFNRHKITIPVEWADPGTPPRVPGPIFQPGPPPGGGTPGGPELASYQDGTDGFMNFGRGTPVILHGWEAVVPAGQTLPSSAPIHITVVSTLDGKEVARNQVRYLPRELQRAGL